MEYTVRISIKLLISFLISGGMLFGGTSLIQYVDPTFSISLFDLLSQVNYSAWLLLALLAGIVFGILLLLPVIVDPVTPGDKKTIGEDQLSD